MPTRREALLAAAVGVLGGRGMRALTHRAVDAEAGLPAGSTANYFPSRESLLEAIVEWVSAQELAHFDEVALTASPTTPAELARVLAAVTRDATGVHRHLTLARYAILVEAGHNATIRHRLAETGNRVGAWFAAWMRLVGARDPVHLHLIADYVTGLVLHQLAMPDPAFDPTGKLTALLESLVEPASTRETETVGRATS